VKGIPLETVRSPRVGRKQRRHRYEEVIQLVRERIASQRLGPGSKLPSNTELAAEAGVSLITVRRALDELERDGEIMRFQGVGTFVGRGRIISEPTKRGGLAQTLAVDRDAVTTTLIELIEGVPPPAVAAVLGLSDDERVWRVVRLRFVAERPRILERATLPNRLVSSIDRATLETGGSLYSMLAQRNGLVDDYEEQYLSLGRPTADERMMLRLEPEEDVIRIRGVAFTPDGTPFDAFEQVYPADGFVFHFAGKTSRSVLAASHDDDWSVAPTQ
jgi:DNA-binding GntR family transcriptional regulator